MFSVTQIVTIPFHTVALSFVIGIGSVLSDDKTVSDGAVLLYCFIASFYVTYALRSIFSFLKQVAKF